MNRVLALYLAIFAVLATGGMWEAWGGALDDPRCCVTEIKRDADGKIARRADVLRAFRDLYPCPATGNKRGACPGWNIDHPIPLACRGLDVVANLQWLPVQIKRCPGLWCKDRWERTVYCRR